MVLTYPLQSRRLWTSHETQEKSAETETHHASLRLTHVHSTCAIKQGKTVSMQPSNRLLSFFFFLFLKDFFFRDVDHFQSLY